MGYEASSDTFPIFTPPQLLYLTSWESQVQRRQTSLNLIIGKRLDWTEKKRNVNKVRPTLLCEFLSKRCWIPGAALICSVLLRSLFTCTLNLIVFALIFQSRTKTYNHHHSLRMRCGWAGLFLQRLNRVSEPSIIGVLLVQRACDQWEGGSHVVCEKQGSKISSCLVLGPRI